MEEFPRQPDQALDCQADSHQGSGLAAAGAIGRTAERPPTGRGPLSWVGRWLNPNPRRVLIGTCWLALVLWCAWWCASAREGELKGVKHTWMLLSFYGCDFYNHIDFPSRLWWQGGNPYTSEVHFFAYPPLVVRLFAWVNATTPRIALTVWQAVMAGFIAVAACVAVKTRRRLALGEVPAILGVVLILASTPVMFAIERGQIDPLTLVFILVSLPLLRCSSGWAQFLAGGVLCLAPWIKVYPGLLALALIGLRRWRALLGFAVVGAAILLLDLDAVRYFLANNQIHISRTEALNRAFPDGPRPWNHPLALVWSSLWTGTSLRWLALIPGKVAAAILLVPPLGWVSYHVYRCPRRAEVTYPYFLWIVALATFVPPLSNDYNLCFLPLAVLAAWDRRDPLLVSVAVALLFLWWQPVGMLIAGKPLLLIKLFGLCAVGVSIVERAAEQASLAGSETGCDPKAAATSSPARSVLAA